MTQIIELLPIFVFGAALGSFLNAIIDRLDTGESIVTSKRSHCDSCQHTLNAWDLVPLFSWLWLNGKCRYCQKPIPIQNPLVELAAGLLLTGLFVNVAKQATMPFNETLPYWIVVFVFWAVCLATLLVIFVYDFKHQIIPDETIVLLVVLAIVYHAVMYLFSGQLYWGLSISNVVLSSIFSALPYFLLIVVTRGKGMGGGDLKFAFVMGLILGYPRVVVAHYLAFLIGGVVAVILLVLKTRRVGQTIPFGPFLIVGTISAFFEGEELIRWFFQTFLTY